MPTQRTAGTLQFQIYVSNSTKPMGDNRIWHSVNIQRQQLSKCLPRSQAKLFTVVGYTASPAVIRLIGSNHLSPTTRSPSSQPYVTAREEESAGFKICTVSTTNHNSIWFPLKWEPLIGCKKSIQINIKILITIGHTIQRVVFGTC